MLGAFLCPRVGLLAVDAGRCWRTDIVNDIYSDLRRMITHRRLRNDLDLTRTQEHAVFWFASEVLDILDGSVILANWFAQFDADPFTGSERGGAIEADEASAYGNFDDAPYHWFGHRRRAVVKGERSKQLSIIDRCHGRILSTLLYGRCPPGMVEDVCDIVSQTIVAKFERIRCYVGIRGIILRSMRKGFISWDPNGFLH